MRYLILLTLLAPVAALAADPSFKHSGTMTFCYPPGDPDRVCVEATLMISEEFAPIVATPPPEPGTAPVVVQTAIGAYAATPAASLQSDPTPENLLVLYAHHRGTVSSPLALPSEWVVEEANFDQSDSTNRRGLAVAFKVADGSERTIRGGWAGVSSQMVVVELENVGAPDVTLSDGLNLPDANAGPALMFIGLKKDGDEPQGTPDYGWPDDFLERANANGGTFQMALGAAFDPAYDGSVIRFTAPAATAEVSARVVFE